MGVTSYGSGYGSGYDDGSGYGYGDGFGFGYDDGSGYGYGYEDGYVAGDTTNDYIRACCALVLGDDLELLLQEGKTVAFWNSDFQGCPVNGGDGGARKIGMQETVMGPLTICSSRALHANVSPWKWRGTRLWIVALSPPVIVQSDKCASLEREIIAEAPQGWFGIKVNEF